MIRWRNVTPDVSADYLVKGTVLNYGIVEGAGNRFGIEEVRTYDRLDGHGLTYRVRDAEMSTDGMIRDGKLPPVVYWSDDLVECISWALEKVGRTPGMDDLYSRDVAD